MVKMIPSSVTLYYTESIEAFQHLLDVIKTYRANTTTILALGTGVTAFFGFDKSHKGAWFGLALGLYAVAAGLALWIHWPIGLQTNMAVDAADDLTIQPPLPAVQVQYEMTVTRQHAIAAAENAIMSRFGIATRFRLLIVAVALTVVAAGLNIMTQQSVPVPPTHIVIDK